MAEQNEVPPQSQKPLSDNGFFSPIWHRFFLKLYRQANKTDDIQTEVSFSETSGGGSGVEAINKHVDELEANQNIDSGA